MPRLCFMDARIASRPVATQAMSASKGEASVAPASTEEQQDGTQRGTTNETALESPSRRPYASSPRRSPAGPPSNMTSPFLWASLRAVSGLHQSFNLKRSRRRRGSGSSFSSFDSFASSTTQMTPRSPLASAQPASGAGAAAGGADVTMGGVGAGAGVGAGVGVASESAAASSPGRARGTMAPTAAGAAAVVVEPPSPPQTQRRNRGGSAMPLVLPTPRVRRRCSSCRVSSGTQALLRVVLRSVSRDYCAAVASRQQLLAELAEAKDKCATLESKIAASEAQVVKVRACTALACGSTRNLCLCPAVAKGEDAGNARKANHYAP